MSSSNYALAVHLQNEIRFFSVRKILVILVSRICRTMAGRWLFKQELRMPDDAWNYYAYLLLLCLLNNIVWPALSTRYGRPAGDW